MRLDRLITLSIARPLRQLAGGVFPTSEFGHRGSGRVLPILMYHSVSESAEASLAAYHSTVTTPDAFSRQMDWLAANGWKGITLAEGLAWLSSQSPRSPTGIEFPPAGTRDLTPAPRQDRPVVITFDDGLQDFHLAAFPSLQRHGFSATMYLPTGFIGDRRQLFSPTTTPHASRTAPPCLNWSEVRELHAAGIEFGSHTVNHPVLYELGWGDIRRELAESRDRLEQELGGSVNAFAYPFRFPAADRDFVVRFGDLLREAGYQSNVTTTIGRARQADPPLALPRLPMNRHDDTALLRSKLAGDYDWLSWPQAVKKRLQRRRALSRSDDVISK